MAMTSIVQRTCDIYETRGAKSYRVTVSEVNEQGLDIGEPLLDKTLDLGAPGIDRCVNFAKRGLVKPGADEAVPTNDDAGTQTPQS